MGENKKYSDVIEFISSLYFRKGSRKWEICNELLDKLVREKRVCYPDFLSEAKYESEYTMRRQVITKLVKRGVLKRKMVWEERKMYVVFNKPFLLKLVAFAIEMLPDYYLEES